LLACNGHLAAIYHARRDVAQPLRAKDIQLSFVRMNTKTIFFLLLILSATGFISPPIALCAGIIFGLAFLHPFADDSRALARFLLQASVVALGFGMNLHEVLKAGRSGFLYTAAGIGFALLAGFL